MNLRLLLLISLTLFFFSTSSILCRLALMQNYIDAYSFTFYRLFFGVVTLYILIVYKHKTIPFKIKQNWLSAFMLFAYALSFSYAYINLDAGVGALILFAVVQLSIIISAMLQKEKLHIQKIVGIVLAFVGLAYLLYPQQSFELSTWHVLLMIISGLAWGVYTILGKKSSDALYHTGDNFLKAFIMIALVYGLFTQNIIVSFEGIILAFLSGGITSSLGYALWYHILPKIQITTSGIIQLIVPVIAIFLSVLFLDERLTLTLLLSTAIILSGITLCLYKKR